VCLVQVPQIIVGTRVVHQYGKAMRKHGVTNTDQQFVHNAKYLSGPAAVDKSIIVVIIVVMTIRIVLLLPFQILDGQARWIPLRPLVTNSFVDVFQKSTSTAAAFAASSRINININVGIGTTPRTTNNGPAAQQERVVGTPRG